MEFSFSTYLFITQHMQNQSFAKNYFNLVCHILKETQAGAQQLLKSSPQNYSDLRNVYTGMEDIEKALFSVNLGIG